MSALCCRILSASLLCSRPGAEPDVLLAQVVIGFLSKHPAQIRQRPRNVSLDR